MFLVFRGNFDFRIPLSDVLVQLEGLKESSQELEKDVKFRKKVIDEILETERSFGSDLNLCVKHFMKQLIEWKVRLKRQNILIVGKDSPTVVAIFVVLPVGATSVDVVQILLS